MPVVVAPLWVRYHPYVTRARASLFALVLIGTAASSAISTGCHTPTVQEAEQKGDVAFLDEASSGDAVAALGRLADTNPAARAALAKRADSDVNVYLAAWAAALRGAPWGGEMLRQGLADPARAGLAASALPRRDIRVAPFVTDLEQSMVRLSSSLQGSVIAAVLSSIGPGAHAAVERRLVDPHTRGAMCQGLSSPDASGDAKSTLLAVPSEARDNPSCVATVTALAKTDEVVLGWLATAAEPGLLSVAAKGDLPCPRLTIVWQRALAERPKETYGALAVPLSFALKRCAHELDPALSALLFQAPAARACIVQAIDPIGAETTELRETCKTLPVATRGGDNRTRERAQDTIENACKNVRQ